MRGAPPSEPAAAGPSAPAGTALDTAVRVLGWACDAVGPAPSGSLAEPGSLGRPDARARDALAGLAARAAARSGAGRAPFGDDGPVGAGALLLAAAVGGRDSPLAAPLAAAAPASRLPPGASGAWKSMNPAVRRLAATAGQS
ncbi:hypothetical protein FraQA3DRAFT_4127, partial [Frankia sp. QA3]